MDHVQEVAAATERRLRVDLAAAFRLAARFGWHEAVANHFSVAVPGDGRRFLMNPRWRHFSRICASDLLLLEAGDEEAMRGPDAPDPTAWAIHAQMHASLPQARCVLHVHSPYATALAALQDPDLRPIDQNTARFFRRLAFDLDYAGFADTEAEGRRLAACLGDRRALVMANHGVLVVGDSVAEAFDSLYYLERACQTMMLAYASGQPLRILPDAIAERTARGWEEYGGWAQAHFEELKRLLDADDPGYVQ
jgi:ribulose-5-phosphate 4-epimerase/fuculose-1-phosphate aldolase